MFCNDRKCIERHPRNAEVCVHAGCSESSFRMTYPLSELVGQVVVTGDCSGAMVQQLDRYNLKPAIFKITEWQKAA